MAGHRIGAAAEHEVDVISQIGDVAATVTVVVKFFKAHRGRTATEHVVHVIGEIRDIATSVMVSITRNHATTATIEVLPETGYEAVGGD